MRVIYKNVFELVGNTPMLYLDRICKEEGCVGQIAAKLERYNPGGSAKDRAALRMIKSARNNGSLREHGTIVEPTSGNMGISLAMYGRLMDYNIIIAMPETASSERVAAIEAYGARVVLTEASLGMSGAVAKAKELVDSIENSIMLEQFSNSENAEAHCMTTGPEIWDDTEGKVDFLVAGIGTGGTICGCARFLKEKNPAIGVIGVEPATSAVISGKDRGEHKIAGIGAGFVPDVYDASCVDEIICVSDEAAFEYCRRLAKSEGIIAGISSGAAVFVAVEIARRETAKDKLIVVILPDMGERYFSVKGLFQRSSSLE